MRLLNQMLNLSRIFDKVVFNLKLSNLVDSDHWYPKLTRETRSFITNNDRTKTRWNRPETAKNAKKIQPPPHNLNLQGKLKKGSSYREFEENSRE